MGTKGWYRLWLLCAVAVLGLGQVVGSALRLRQGAEVGEVQRVHSQVVSGVVIRQEQLVYAPYPGFWETEEDERRVSRGGKLFSLREGNDREALRVRLLAGGISASALPLPERREEIHRAIARMQQTGDPEEVMMAVLGEAPPGTEELEEAKEALARKSWQRAYIYAPVGGILIEAVDGYEGVLTPEQPDPGEAPEIPAGAVGRIITDPVWYFRGVLPRCPEPGEKITVEILSGVFRTVTMTVERREETEGGYLVLLRCNEGVEDVGKLRRVSLKIFTE